MAPPPSGIHHFVTMPMSVCVLFVWHKVSSCVNKKKSKQSLLSICICRLSWNKRALSRHHNVWFITSANFFCLWASVCDFRLWSSSESGHFASWLLLSHTHIPPLHSFWPWGPRPHHTNLTRRGLIVSPPGRLSMGLQCGDTQPPTINCMLMHVSW